MIKGNKLIELGFKPNKYFGAALARTSTQVTR